jgi:hypothetical protein
MITAYVLINITCALLYFLSWINKLSGYGPDKYLNIFYIIHLPVNVKFSAKVTTVCGSISGSPIIFFFFQALNYLVQSFGLLNDLFPLPSILDAGYVVLIFIWQMSCVMLSSHLYLGFPCDFLGRGFQLNIFRTVLVSGIICTWPNQLSLWALMCLRSSIVGKNFVLQVGRRTVVT